MSEEQLTKTQRLELTKEIADQLGEENRFARKQINWMVERFGEDFVRELVQEAIQVEADGGMMTLDGSRRRTLGGVFFRLAKSREGKVWEEFIDLLRKEKAERKARKAAKRAAQEAEAQNKQETTTAPAKEASQQQPAKPVPQASEPASPQPATTTPSPELSPQQQLEQLWETHDAIQARIDAIKDRPPEQQQGLADALRELRAVKAQIKEAKKRG